MSTIMDLGNANIVLSSKLKLSICISTRPMTDHEVWNKTSKKLCNGGNDEFWICVECDKLTEDGDSNDGANYGL
uniref:Uncharacterized protein n=1 Tax=Romanomermis culicivorax TaxID=13658 RepID=A0A915JVH2_ROMCU